jgi:hypothetical protein
MLQFIEVVDEGGATTLVNISTIAVIQRHHLFTENAEIGTNFGKFRTVLTYDELRRRLCGQSSNPMLEVLN